MIQADRRRLIRRRKDPTMKTCTVGINRTSVEALLWRIQSYLIRKHGTRQAEIDMYPLRWYIDTGRASIGFLRVLFSAEPFMIARRLHAGGSYDEAISRLKDYLHYTDD